MCIIGTGSLVLVIHCSHFWVFNFKKLLLNAFACVCVCEVEALRGELDVWVNAGELYIFLAMIPFQLFHSGYNPASDFLYVMWDENERHRDRERYPPKRGLEEEKEQRIGLNLRRGAEERTCFTLRGWKWWGDNSEMEGEGIKLVYMLHTHHLSCGGICHQK